MSKTLKALIIILVLIILGGTAGLKIYTDKKKNKSLADSCKEIFAPSCQQYLIEITKDKKFEEAVKIQKTRIDENEKLINEHKKRIKNKRWLVINSEEMNKEFPKIKTENENKNGNLQKLDEQGRPVFEDFEKDYSHLVDTVNILNDVSLDTAIVATIQRKELKDYEGAIKTLENGKRILEENNFAPFYENHLQMFERNIKKNQKLIEEEKATSESKK